mgnify:FL=1
MYIHMYTMAKTIMVSNDVYNNLKAIKERENKSYSEVILESLEKSKMKTGEGLRECLGLLEGDKEYDKVMKEVKKGWDRWNKRYA